LKPTFIWFAIAIGSHIFLEHSLYLNQTHHTCHVPWNRLFL
jgi:hypothetical protein